DGRGGRSFDDELAPLHHPNHRVEDVAIGQGDDDVHEALNDGEVDLAGAPHAQTIDDRVALDGLKGPGRNARLHGGTVGRLHADDFDAWIVTLGGHRDAGDQAATPDWDDHRVEVRPVLNDFETEGALARDELFVVERMHVGETLRANQLLGLFVR